MSPVPATASRPVKASLLALLL
ncbi:MAG: hypothetical protein UZ13_01425, partial [Chloroflexi bacterium OLB13]